MLPRVRTAKKVPSLDPKITSPPTPITGPERTGPSTAGAAPGAPPQNWGAVCARAQRTTGLADMAALKAPRPVKRRVLAASCPPLRMNWGHTGCGRAVVVAVEHAVTDTVTETEPEEQGDDESEPEADTVAQSEGDAVGEREPEAHAVGEREYVAEPHAEGLGEGEPLPDAQPLAERE